MPATTTASRTGCELDLDRTAPTEATRVTRTACVMGGGLANELTRTAEATPGPISELTLARVATTTDSAESHADGQATTATSASTPVAAPTKRRADRPRRPSLRGPGVLIMWSPRCVRGGSRHPRR